MILQEEIVPLPARPPRGPSPIVDTSNTRPSTIAQRSTSVPLKLPPKPTRTSSPIVRSSANAHSSHFLSEFNVDACSDVRSIPDPPTPQPRARRRLSSPMLLNLSAQARDPALDAENLPHYVPQKRSRKSLCHVPSPSLPEQRDDAYVTIESGSSHSTDSPVSTHRKTSGNLCLDSTPDHHSDSISSNKRRKKRQSMELPRDWVQQHAHSLAASPEELRANSISPNNIPSEKVRKLPPFVGDLESLKRLQTMVRQYCSTPKDQRPTCTSARDIEESTDYPLLQPVFDSHPLSHSNRRAVLQKMAPVIEEIDKRKIEETEKWQRETECRVERSKSGRYRYIAIATNTKVPSQEYKNRYMAVLEREAPVRLARANEWKAKLNMKLSSLDSQRPDTSVYTKEAWDALMPVATDMETEETDYAITQELDLSSVLAMNVKPNDESMTRNTQQECLLGDQSSMEICDTSVSMMEVEESELPLDFEPPRPMLAKHPSLRESPFKNPADDEKRTPIQDAPNSEINLDTTIKPTVSNEDEQEGHSTGGEVSNGDATIHESATLEAPAAHTAIVTRNSSQLLPFPDRDATSKDPDIARAEQRLWSRIDAALQEYSHDVIMILNRRNPGVQAISD